MVAISPTLPKYSAEARRQHRLTFDLLSDLHNEVGRRFGVVYTMPDYLIDIYKKLSINLPDYNGDESWTLPIPARFIVTQDGIIGKVDADPDYTHRPEPDDAVDFLKKLK